MFGFKIPTIISINVDFPEPLLPIIPIVVLALISKLDFQ